MPSLTYQSRRIPLPTDRAVPTTDNPDHLQPSPIPIDEPCPHRPSPPDNPCQFCARLPLTDFPVPSFSYPSSPSRPARLLIPGPTAEPDEPFHPEPTILVSSYHSVPTSTHLIPSIAPPRQTVSTPTSDDPVRPGTLPHQVRRPRSLRFPSPPTSQDAYASPLTTRRESHSGPPQPRRIQSARQPSPPPTFHLGNQPVHS